MPYKNPGIAVILAIFFGPLGVLYASVGVGFLCCVAMVVVTFTYPIVGNIIVWVASVILAGLFAEAFNERERARVGRG